MTRETYFIDCQLFRSCRKLYRLPMNGPAETKIYESPSH